MTAKSSNPSSETTSIASSMYAGYIENGRRYQTVREDKYWGPSDEQQFETMEAGHLLYQILDSQETNTLFRSPIPDTAQHIIDLGTGDGTWALEVADRFPGSNRAVPSAPPSITY